MNQSAALYYNITITNIAICVVSVLWGELTIAEQRIMNYELMKYVTMDYGHKLTEFIVKYEILNLIERLHDFMTDFSRPDLS